MSLVWWPGIWRDDTSDWFPLPRPVQDVDDDGGRDFTTHKVPHADGAIVTAPSKKVVSISVRGIASMTGYSVVYADETTTTAAIATMQTKLAGDTDGKFWFVLYYEASSSTYRYWKDCILSGFATKRGRADRFVPYTIQITAHDPTLYDTKSGNLT